MKNIILLFGSLILITACDNDLDQTPPKKLESGNLTNVEGVLNAAYHYQTGSPTPLVIMGDFRADNMLMLEEPYPAFDRFNADLAGGDLVEQFFRPFYSNLFNSILSSNSVIENSSDGTQIAEALFLRALSYFKLVMAFGDISVILIPQPNIDEISTIDFARRPADEVYDNVIIPDFQAAIAALDNSGLANGRATQIAARGFLGKVYMHRGNFSAAERELQTVLGDADAAGITLEADFANVVIDESSEILFSTQVSSTIPDEYTSGSEYPGWFNGKDSKALQPLDPDLAAAFDASAAAGGGTDLRKSLTIDEANTNGVKFVDNQEQDFIELRLSDVILMYAEALNENGSPAAEVLDLLDPIRTRAGLTVLEDNALSSQADVRQAIQDERRLELALEGHRWFDLVRTNTVDAEMGQTIDPNYYVFPIPNSEVLASDGVITQNPGY